MIEDIRTAWAGTSASNAQVRPGVIKTFGQGTISHAQSQRTHLGIIFFPAFDWAISPTHPERQERLLYTQDQLREEGLFDIEGIRRIQARRSLGSKTWSASTSASRKSPAVATRSHLISAGGAMKAADLVMERANGISAFAMVRPPGHHAMKVVHGSRGFCNINIEADDDRAYPRKIRPQARGHRGHRLPPRRRHPGRVLARPGHPVYLPAPGRAHPLPRHRLPSANWAGPTPGAVPSTSPCRPTPRTRGSSWPWNGSSCPFSTISSRTWSSIPRGRTTTSPTPSPT